MAIVSSDDLAHRVWSPGWSDRILERLKSLGFSSVLDYFDAFADESLNGLCARLGADVAPVQLTDLFVRESLASSSARQAAMELLVRCLRDQFPAGWICSDDFGAGLILARCSRPFRRAGAAGAYEFVTSAWRCVVTAPPEEGWWPVDCHDGLLVAAFAEGWPTSGHNPST